MISTSPLTWRSYLDGICRQMKPWQKAQFEKEVGITFASINRWRRGKDTPKPENMEKILAALPEQQSLQLKMLLREDPKMNPLFLGQTQATFSSPEESQELLLRRGILDHFFLHLLRLQRESPEPFWQLSGRILRQALTELETHPQNSGLNLVLCKCMPPKEGKVRSLRRLVAMGSAPFRRDLHDEEFFLGAESLAGHVLAKFHGEHIPDLEQNYLHIPFQLEEGGGADQKVCSLAAYPIVKKLRVAGVLLAVAREPYFFTQERLALLEMFADIAGFVFEDRDFVPIEDLALDLLPPLSQQRAHFASFISRVQATLLEWRQERALETQDLPLAEEYVRSLIEDELRQAQREQQVSC